MQQGDYESFLEAARAQRRGDITRAIQIYETLISEGDIYALVLLGSIYARGTGVPVDLEKAEELYNRAAALGSTEATFQLADVWRERGDMQKYFLAIQEAAHQDLLVAKFFLARCYLKGRGTTKDEAKAMELMHELAGCGYVRAKMYLARRQLIRIYNPFGVLLGLIRLLSAAFEGLLMSMVDPRDERVR